MLEINGLSKSFNGFSAVSDGSLRVEAQETHAIIGPNGAGKTTFFNLISGHLRADEGTVRFFGQPITGLSPSQIVRHGIARSFQHINVFPRLTAVANVQAAVIARRRQQLRFFGSAGNQQREAGDLLSIVGLESQADRIAAELAYGQQKQLELAIALAAEPRVLLLDEPTAGMSADEPRKATGLIKRIQGARGLVLLFTEHDMDVVFDIADRISVLHHGELIATGRPGEIRDDPKVRGIYLGEEWKN